MFLSSLGALEPEWVAIIGISFDWKTDTLRGIRRNSTTSLRFKSPDWRTRDRTSPAISFNETFPHLTTASVMAFNAWANCFPMFWSCLACSSIGARAFSILANIRRVLSGSLTTFVEVFTRLSFFGSFELEDILRELVEWVPSLVLVACRLLVLGRRGVLEEYGMKQVSEELSPSLEFPYCECLS